MKQVVELTFGWSYTATLWLRTSLACLESGGEFSPGSEQLPLVGPV